MSKFDQIVMIYIAITFINTFTALVLYLINKSSLYRSLLLVWCSTVFSVVIQGMLTWNNLLISLGMLSNFLNSLALSYLMISIIDIRFPYKRFILIMILSYVPSFYFYFNGYNFSFITFFNALATATPLFYTGIVSLKKLQKDASITTKCLAVSYLFFAIHYLDYPFIRIHPKYSDEGFTLGLLIIFAISLFSLASVIETVLRNETDKIEQQLGNKLDEANKKLKVQSEREAEYKLARKFQTRYLPELYPYKGIKPSVFHLPSKLMVSGDFYDIHVSSDNDIGYLIADVAGKGIESSYVTIQLHQILRTKFVRKTSPKKIMQRLNIEVQELKTLKKMCAGVFVSFAPNKKILTYSLAGLDVLFIARKGQIFDLNEGAPPLGFADSIDFVEDTFSYQVGDILVVSTDGILDAQNTKKERFGTDRLKNFFIEVTKSDVPHKNIKDSLSDIFHDFVEDHPLVDDVTVLMFEIET